MNDDNKKSFKAFPEEMPKADKKQYGHGVIENVVKNEIHPSCAEKPIAPVNTDSINSEFAKKRNNSNM